MTSEYERWAEAAMALRQHGGFAPVFVAERIGFLALDGDMAGVARLTATAEKVYQLITAPHV